MLVGDNSERYVRAQFKDEAELEAVVQANAHLLFGPSAIYLPRARIVTNGGAGTVTDGFVIQLANREWYIVEVERAVHGVWNHIAPQVGRQITAARDPAAIERILKLAMDAYRERDDVQRSFAEHGIAAVDVHGTLREILATQPIVAIPIDAMAKDLEEWAAGLVHTVKVWVIEKYVSLDDESRTLYRLPDDDNAPTVTMRGTGDDRRVETVAVGGPLAALIAAGELADGAAVYFDYQPRGAAERRQFTGIARGEGIEIDGKLLSPSAAAVYCIQKGGGQPSTANGWVRWKTGKGEVLAALRDRVPATESGASSG